MIERISDDSDPVAVSIEEVREAYEFERQRYRDELARSNIEYVRATFDERRAIAREKLAVATDAYLRCHAAAYRARSAYARRAPNRVVNGRPIKPDVWDWFLSCGRLTDMYAEVVLTTNAAVAALRSRRRLEAAEQHLEDQYKRALHLREEALSKWLVSVPGLREFHARPGVADLCRRLFEHQERESGNESRDGWKHSLTSTSAASR